MIFCGETVEASCHFCADLFFGDIVLPVGGYDLLHGTVEVSCQSCADLFVGKIAPGETVNIISRCGADPVVEGVTHRPAGRDDISGETAEVISHSRTETRC